MTRVLSEVKEQAMHKWGLEASRKSEQQFRSPEVEVGWMYPRNREEARAGGSHQGKVLAAEA